MSKYKYQKEFLFSTKRLQDIQLFIQNEESLLELMSIRDATKNTVIHHCAFLNQHRHIEFYIKYYRRNLENDGHTLAEIKTRTRLLLDTKNAEGYTAAHYAAFKGNVTVLKCLQKYEANLALPSDLGMSLLHFAAQGDKINTVMHLHERDIDRNGKDSKGSTPLHWACFSGSEKVVEYLLAQPGILLEEKDQDGHTPLHIAVVYGYSKIVRKLLVAGADRKATNGKGQAALQIAQSNQFEKIARMLNDKYSLLDYLKFICNAKARYQPRDRSYLQPTLYYLFALTVATLSYAVIEFYSPFLFWIQSIVYAASIVLFSSLILPPKPWPKQHSYGYFAEREQMGRLCMECIRVMQAREYHCTTCHTCTSQYDHHCFWINNCVGKNNILRFNLFLILSQIALCWAAFLATRTFILLQAGLNDTDLFSLRGWVRQSGFEAAAITVCVAIWVVFLLLAFPMFCLILVQQKNLLLGKTTYQRFSKSNESVLTREGSDLLRRSWESPAPSLKNCVGMCYKEGEEEKGSQSNSTSSSFVQEH